MPKHDPAPEFAALAPSRHLKTFMASDWPEMHTIPGAAYSTTDQPKMWSLEEARDLALQAAWPALALIRESIRHSNTSEEQLHRLRATPDKWALEPWSPTPDPLWNLWIPPEALAQAAQALASQDLLVSRGVLTQQELANWDPAVQRKTGIRETMGSSTWVQQALRALAKLMPEYWTDLKWQPMDLNRLWIAGCSDLGGDQMLVVHGTQEALLRASKSLVPARFQGLPVNLILNSSIQQALPPWQASILLPGALRTSLVWLD